MKTTISINFLIALLVLLAACSPSPATPASRLEAAIPTNVAPATTNVPAITPARQPTETLAPTAISSPITSLQDKAHFISETYPDGSNVAPGAAFQKSWKLQNIGTTTWTTDYKLVYVSSSLSDERLGSQDTITLSKMVNPGEIIDVSVPLTAPQTPGQYKVTWRLLNPQGQSISVDGYDLWVLVNVGNVQANTSGSSIQQSVTASGIRVDLVETDYSEQNVSIKYCITLPDDTNWFPQDMWVSANGQATSVGFALSGSKQDSSTFAAYRCYISTIADVVKTGDTFSFSIGFIGKDGTLEGDCPLAQQKLAIQYPDLKFTCLTAGAFYTLIQKPKRMSDQQADRIIMDAIQKNIYGPWVFNITR